MGEQSIRKDFAVQAQEPAKGLNIDSLVKGQELWVVNGWTPYDTFLVSKIVFAKAFGPKRIKADNKVIHVLSDCFASESEAIAAAVAMKDSQIENLMRQVSLLKAGRAKAADQLLVARMREKDRK